MKKKNHLIQRMSPSATLTDPRARQPRGFLQMSFRPPPRVGRGGSELARAHRLRDPGCVAAIRGAGPERPIALLCSALPSRPSVPVPEAGRAARPPLGR